MDKAQVVIKCYKAKGEVRATQYKADHALQKPSRVVEQHRVNNPQHQFGVKQFQRAGPHLA